MINTNLLWSNERFVELVDEHKITYTSAATPFRHDTLNAPNLDRHDLSSLQRFCCMGAPVPPAIVRAAQARFPGLTVLGGWGQTRTAWSLWASRAIRRTSSPASVAVIGVPDPRLQERDCACVVLRPGVDGFTFEEMKAFLAEKGIAKQYWPERLEVLPALPSTASGKIQKYKLRQQVGGAS